MERERLYREIKTILDLVFFVLFWLTGMIMELLILQFTLSAISVLRTFKALNDYLNNILTKIYDNAATKTTPLSLLYKPRVIKRSSFNIFSRSVQNSFANEIKTKIINVSEGVHTFPSSIRRCALFYCTLCNVIRRLNNAYGFILVILFLTVLLHLIITPYHLIMQLQVQTSSKMLKIFLHCSWLIYHVSNLFLMVEPCHRTHEQMDAIRDIINQMKRYTLPGDHSLTSELKMFQRHINLNPVTFSPLQFFTLNRSIYVTVLGSVITYLIIFLQL